MPVSIRVRVINLPAAEATRPASSSVVARRVAAPKHAELDVEIWGTVTAYASKYVKGEARLYSFVGEKHSGVLQIPATMFCRLDIGDVFFAFVHRDTKGVYTLLRFPTVSPTTTQAGVVGVIARLCGRIKVRLDPEHVFEVLADYAQHEVDLVAESISWTRSEMPPALCGDGGVVAYLNDLAQNHKIFGLNSSARTLMTVGLEYGQACEFLDLWFDLQVKRRFELLQFSLLNFNFYKYHNMNRVYSDAIENASRLIEMTWAEITAISEITHITLTERDAYLYSIASYVHKRCISSSWTCVPMRVLEREFPCVRSEMGILEKEYRLYYDMSLNVVYTERNYIMETRMTTYFNKLIEMTVAEYAIIPPSADMASSHLSNFACSSLTEEQRLAVYGSQLGHLSIITGMGGSGKCLGRGTRLRLYSGETIAVENLQVGDAILGMNLQKVLVKSLAHGIGPQYRVACSNGYNFTCNDAHLLTLISDLRPTANGNVLSYGRRGVSKSVECLSNAAAQDLASLIPPDIFDVSVTELLSWPHWRRSRVRMFRIDVKSSGVIRSTTQLAIQHLGLEEYFGFECDAIDGRFVLEDYSVTHNTTVIREIRESCQMRGLEVAIASFMGKAVSRIQEVLEDDSAAATLDLMIVSPFSYKFDVLIIDEASTLCLDLMYRFIRAFQHRFRIILVGDCNQLPPIGGGWIMEQLIASKRVPIFTLTVNQRLCTSAKSKGVETTIRNTNWLVSRNRNRSQPMIFEESDQFHVFKGDIMLVQSIAKSLLATGVSYRDLLIIAPYVKEVESLNIYLQSICTGKNLSVTDEAGKTWRIGDRVMILHNNYKLFDINGAESRVSNGQEGYIIDVNGQELTLEMARATFRVSLEKPRGMVDAVTNVKKGALTTADISLSYCVTTHKAQGDEYPFVIVYLPTPRRNEETKRCSSFVNDHLLYVAVTRQEKCNWVISENCALEIAASTKLLRRHEYLNRRLLQLANPEREHVLANFNTVKAPKDYIANGTLDEQEELLDEPDDDFWDEE